MRFIPTDKEEFKAFMKRAGFKFSDEQPFHDSFATNLSVFLKFRTGLHDPFHRKRGLSVEKLICGDNFFHGLLFRKLSKLRRFEYDEAQESSGSRSDRRNGAASGAPAGGKRISD